MIKEIKFRVYHNTYIHSCPLDKLQSMLDQGSPIMQYTGLKDKHGKEIYEGDIIQHKTINIHKQIVRYAYAGFQPFCDELGDEYCTNDSDSENWEVIGNIYENPDLIK